MNVHLLDSAGELADRAAPLLTARIEHNIAATVLQTIRDSPRGPAAVFALVTDDGDEPIAFALRTPPHPLLVSVLDDSIAEPLIGRVLEVDPDLPGVNGTPRSARAVARAWERATGGAVTVALSEAMHVLDRVLEPPRPADGEMRLATSADREQVVAWWRDFEAETGLAPGSEESVNWRLERGFIWFWDDRGTTVAVAGNSSVVAGVARIGPVYTPPAHRGHGYASCLVAALSSHLLAGGADRCMLYTDLANPTSNKIYASVGYRRVSDWEELAFSRAD